MITTAPAPPWLRRSDQAVTWARTMLTPGRAVVIDCETTDLPGALTGVRYSNLRNNQNQRRGADEMRCDRDNPVRSLAERPEGGRFV
jgi:hypothetical protein